MSYWRRPRDRAGTHGQIAAPDWCEWGTLGSQLLPRPRHRWQEKYSLVGRAARQLDLGLQSCTWTNHKNQRSERCAWMLRASMTCSCKEEWTKTRPQRCDAPIKSYRNQHRDFIYKLHCHRNAESRVNNGRNNKKKHPRTSALTARRSHRGEKTNLHGPKSQVHFLLSWKDHAAVTSSSFYFDILQTGNMRLH